MIPRQCWKFQAFLGLICLYVAFSQRLKSKNEVELAELEKRAVKYLKEKNWLRSYETWQQVWRKYKKLPQANEKETFRIFQQLVISAEKMGAIDKSHHLHEYALNNFKFPDKQRSRIQEYVANLAKKISARAQKILEKDPDEIEKLSAEENKKLAQDMLHMPNFASCRKESIEQSRRKMAENPNLSCRLHNRNSNPLLLLAPVKEEILSLNPMVVVFYDIILPSEIEHFQKTAGPDLDYPKFTTNRNKLLKFPFNKRRVKVLKIADDAWMEKLNRRVQAYTGLAVAGMASEAWQIGRYGVGGHFVPHVDPLQLPLLTNDTGDRLATLMLYMSDVDDGGGTAFVRDNVHVAAKAGSGLFWFNMRQNETTDHRVKHTGCPVVSGTKWIANKWFRERDQFLHRPCSLKQNDDYSLPEADPRPHLHSLQFQAQFYGLQHAPSRLAY